MNKRNVKEYFEDIASDFDSYYDKPDGYLDSIINAWLRRPGLLKRLEISLDLSDPKIGKNVLDIGCGSGKFVVECAKKGATVVGIDISKEMIEIAKEFCKKNNVDVDLKVGDATIGLPEGFDVCIALGVFEYFKDPMPILKNMMKSTKQGGKVIFSVPSSYALQTPLRNMLLYYRNVKCYYHTRNSVESLLYDLKSNIRKTEIYSYGPGMVVYTEKV